MNGVFLLNSHGFTSRRRYFCFLLQERVKNLRVLQFVSGELVGGLDTMKELNLKSKTPFKK